MIEPPAAVLRCRSMLIRGEQRHGEVLVTIGGELLDWRLSLAARNHSPTGPEWGHGGSGSAQLALAILLAVTDQATAEQFYQQFKWGVIAPIRADRWVLEVADVLRWIELSAERDDIVRMAVQT